MADEKIYDIDNDGNVTIECGFPHRGKELKKLPETKLSNPKDSMGIKKVPMSCIPSGPLLELGLAMMEGARKYGRHNYRSVGVRWSVYHDAVMRHMLAAWEGEDIDPDSGVSHIIKAMASLIVLRDSQLMGNCTDDRPIIYPQTLDMSKLNYKASAIISKYPICVAPFTEKGEQ